MKKTIFAAGILFASMLIFSGCGSNADRGGSTDKVLSSETQQQSQQAQKSTISESVLQSEKPEMDENDNPDPDPWGTNDLKGAETKGEEDNPFLPSDTNAYTRQEWLTDLMEILDFTLTTSDLQSSYIDVLDENPYLHAIEIAKNYQVITTDEVETMVIDGVEVSGPVIRPNDPTEREFAVLTALKALGYVNIDTLSSQYKIAVKTGILNPDLNGTPFTTQEAKEMLGVVAQIAAGSSASS